jgi:hypothetical protein
MHTEQVSTSLNLTLILKLRHYYKFNNQGNGRGVSYPRSFFSLRAIVGKVKRKKAFQQQQAGAPS